VRGLTFCSNVKAPYYSIISLRAEVWAQKTSLALHFLLKFLYQDKKENSVLVISILPLFRLDFGTGIFFHFIIARNFYLIFFELFEEKKLSSLLSDISFFMALMTCVSITTGSLILVYHKTTFKSCQLNLNIHLLDMTF
jgi:hypothetical protein